MNDKPIYIVYREYYSGKQVYHGIIYITDDEKDAIEVQKKLVNIYKILRQQVIIAIRKMHLYDDTTVKILQEVAEVGEIYADDDISDFEDDSENKFPLFE